MTSDWPVIRVKRTIDVVGGTLPGKCELFVADLLARVQANPAQRGRLRGRRHGRDDD